MHAIRELTHQLNESRSHTNHLSSETLPTTSSRTEYDEKLERCCQRLEQLTIKVDRLLSFEQTGPFMLIFSIRTNKDLVESLGVTARPSRPSPNTAPVEIISATDPQVTLSDTQYDRLEAMLIEKIQTYVQGGQSLL